MLTNAMAGLDKSVTPINNGHFKIGSGSESRIIYTFQSLQHFYQIKNNKYSAYKSFEIA